jgi:hypothetical protein
MMGRLPDISRYAAIALMALLLIACARPFCIAESRIGTPVAAENSYGRPVDRSAPAQSSQLPSCDTACPGLPAAPPVMASLAEHVSADVFATPIRTRNGRDGGPAPPPPRA